MPYPLLKGKSRNIWRHGMHCEIDDNAIKASAAKWQGDSLHVEMMNGRTLIVPIWLLPELKELSPDEISNIEIIEGGRGLLFGDTEAISMETLIGITYGDDEKGTGTFGLV